MKGSEERQKGRFDHIGELSIEGELKPAYNAYSEIYTKTKITKTKTKSIKFAF